MSQYIAALIPARKGSKGVPDKNIQILGGKNLIEHAIIAGKESKLISDIWISTDSKEYEKIALLNGAKSFGLRPPMLANDIAKTIDVALNWLDSFDDELPEIIVLLQPTSPLRNGVLIDNVIRTIKNYDAVITVSLLEEPHPFKLKKIEDGILKPFIEEANSEVPRQKLPEAYQLTGAVYAIRTKVLMQEKTFFPANTAPFIVDNFINIDTVQDLVLAQNYFETIKNK